MVELLLLGIFIVCTLLFVFRKRMLNYAAICAVALALAGFAFYFIDRFSSYTVYFNADGLSIFFVRVLAAVFFCVAMYTIPFLKHKELTAERHTFYTVFLLLFAGSMVGVLMSSHLGLLWVFIEATTLCSTPLVYFERNKASLEATWKYLFVCSIGITLAFVGIIFISMGAGNINSLFFADLYKNAGSIAPFWLKLAFPFILVGFGTKAGLAPVHAWLPDAHAESPSPVSALLSATLLNSALLGILRVYKILCAANMNSFADTLLLVMGFLSLFICAVFVLSVRNYKRMLAYSSIENMGIIVIGIAFGGIGVFASMLHVLSHSFAKASFFLTSGNILHRYHTKDSDKIRGMFKTFPATGWLWMFSLMAIVALPPFPSFISELLMIKQMISVKSIALLIIFLLLLTVILYGMSVMIFKMCFGNPLESAPAAKQKFSLFEYFPQIVLLAALIWFGVYMPEYVNQMLIAAAGLIK